MILVVVGHCTYYTIAGPSEYGGIDYAGAMEAAGVMDTYVHAWTSVLTMFIYTFHMPLFMAISGAVLVVSRFFRKFISSASKYRHQMYGFSSSAGCSISILNRCSMSI